MADGSTTLRVVIVDDHLIVRREVRRLVEEAEATVVGEAATLAGALAETLDKQPDVLILDLDLPDGSGLSIIRRVRESAPGCQVVVLTASTADADIRDALEAGATGYLTKDLTGAGVVSAISNAALGLTTVAGSAMLSLLGTSSPRTAAAREALGRLSARELEVLALLADGLSAAEVAAHLGISTRTIEGHARNVLARLSARNRAEAVRLFADAQLEPSALPGEQRGDPGHRSP